MSSRNDFIWAGRFLAGVDDLRIDAKQRTRLVGRILTHLKEAAPGSKVFLRGSLADGSADEYSDIDLIWEIPDPLFKSCVDDLEEILSDIHPVESLRSHPDYQKSEGRRLVFARFEGVPLFWRLDMDICAESVARDTEYGLHNANAKGSEWSLTESSLMNTVAAVKAHLRGRDDDAMRLLERAYERVGLDLPSMGLRELMAELAHSVEVMDPKLTALVERIERLVQGAF